MTAFTEPISEDIEEYTWKLKMDNLNYTNGYSKSFGITNDSSKSAFYGFCWYNNVNEGFYSRVKKQDSSGNWSSWRNYSSGLSTNDVLEIKFNQKERTLEFIVD